MSNKSPFDTEYRYNFSSSMKEIEEALEQARDGKYQCLLSSYRASHSQLEIKMWGGEWGTGNILLAGEVAFIKAQTRWAECQLKQFREVWS
jgi:hypothetical protein